ncbi:uracil permease [Apiospora saccharicola]
MVRLPSRHALSAPFQSAEAFRDFVRAPQTAGGREQIGNEKWSNRDLEPTPPEERTWTAMSLPVYWFTNMFSVTGWNVAASLMAVGLTWQQAFIWVAEFPFNGINVIMGTLSPMLVNQPDLARYCQKPWHAGALQGIVAFTAKVLVLFLGLASTAVLTPTLGKAYWNLWDLLDAILDHYWGPAARGGVFLVSLSFLLAVIATNFGSNSIPFGADLTGLFPKYMTIKRGQVLCAILGVAVVPWELLASAQAFLSFLGSYDIFMAPLCGTIITDYVWAKAGNYHIPSAYDGTKESAYWYWLGPHSSTKAWVGGMALGLPGLVAQYQPQAVSQAAKDLYKLGWVLTFTTASVLYGIMTFFIKPRILPVGYESVPLSFGYMAKSGRDGFLDGERDGVGVAVSQCRSVACLDSGRGQ